MKFWHRGYFIQSSQYNRDGTKFNDSWSVRTAPFWNSPVHVAREYAKEKEEELGGETFFKEFRRI